MSITVVIAEGQPLYLSGLRHELSRKPSIQVVGETPSGDEALQLVEHLRPDVLLLGMGLVGAPPDVVAARLHERRAGTRVVAIGPPGRDYVVAMLAAGIAGYVLRNETPVHLVQAVEAAARGDRWLRRGAALALAAREAPAASEVAPLTPREREVLALLANGLDNGGIAASLCVSLPTVRFHLRNLYRKLGLAGRGELVAWAAHQGELDGQAGQSPPP